MKYCSIILLLIFELSVTIAQTDHDSIKYHFPIMTVTGTRYVEPWITVPLSLTNIEAKDLPKGKGYGLDEALSAVPGVLVQSRFGNQDIRLTIRGFGARGAGERSNAGTSRGVRILNNGFPETEPDGRTSFDLIDIAGAGSIEVIRSNASSIYGNASGGVVNIMSNTSFESPYLSYGEALGSFGFRKELVNAGAMLGDGRLYFSMSNTNWDGWRAQARSSQMLLSAGIVSHIGERTNIGVHVSGTSNIFRIPGPLTLAQYETSPQLSDSLYVARDERRFNRLGRIGINVTHELDGNNMFTAMTFVQPKFIQRSERNTYRDFNRYHVGGSIMYRNLLEFSPSTKNIFLMGIDEAYQDGAILFYNLTALSGRGLLSDNKREGANNFGFFLQDELTLGEEWLALAGLRYDNITYYSEGYFQAPASRKSETKSYERVTPKAGITYRLSPTHSLYANFGGGVEVPAGNETDPSGTVPGDSVYAINPLLDLITSMTFEVGTKQMITLGGEKPYAHLSYDIAAYWLRVSNDIVPYRNGRFYFTSGKTERMGLEIGAMIQFTNGITANVSLTGSNNEYKYYHVDSVHLGGAQGKYIDYSGNKVVGIPEVFYTAGVKYASEELKEAYIKANFQSVGTYYADDANKILIPSYAILNAGIGIDRMTFVDDKFFLNAYLGVNNLTDAKYIGSAWLNPDYPASLGGKAAYIEPALPRNFIASIGFGLNL